MTTRIQTFGGNIGIGTDDPGSFKLNVNGDVKADSLIINGVTNSQVPIGLLGIWYGSVETIPTGWHICDGTTNITRSDGNGVINAPDLRNRFVRGVNSAPQVGQTAGVNTVTLSEANLAGHAHPFSTGNNSAPHDHGTSNNSNAPHGHGTSGNSNMPHTHPTADHEVPHSHGGESTQTNAPHSHNAIASNMPHSGHNGVNKSTPHTHSIPQVNVNVQLGSPNYQPRGFMIRNNNLSNTSQSNAPHNHGDTGAAASLHSHPNTPVDPTHDHTTEAAGGQHAHGIPATSGNASHSHSDVPSQNITHPHTSNASNMLHPHTGTTNQTGQGESTSVTNPYHLLAYIMKI
jgi:hypothetical protein